MQIERTKTLNTVVTSKEEILKVSRRLIQTQGKNAINIRNVARECGISVGSIYNYFGNKSDLITETVSSVWQDIFMFPEEGFPSDSFTGCIEWAFESLKKGEEKYPGFFSLHSLVFAGSEKSEGHKLMIQSWNHMKAAFMAVLRQDPNVSKDAFDESFTEEDFAGTIFSLMIAALVQKDYNPAHIINLVNRLIYQKSAR